MDRLIVHPYDWQIIDGSSSVEPTELRAWCLDEKSKPYLLRVCNFPVFTHLELPTIVDNRPFTWNDTKAKRVFRYLQNSLGKHSPLRCLHKEATKLYYLQESKTPFLLLTFSNLKAMYACRDKVNMPRKIYKIGDEVKLTLHEYNITMVRKYLTAQDSGYSQWASIDGRLVSDTERVSRLENEYIVDYESWMPLDLDTVTSPGVLAIDLEAHSDNPKAFPNAHYTKDDAYMLSCVYTRLGKPETMRKILILYGISTPPNKSEWELIQVNNEVDLCRAFARTVRELDPEILTGYNIFGFDYKYLDRRLKRCGMDWEEMGRIRHEKAYLDSKDWSSSGYGHNSINILRMSGRISVDMLPLIKREHKLPKYGLDAVANHFLGRGKNNVTAQMMFSVIALAKKLEEILETMRSAVERKNTSEDGKLTIMLKLRNSTNIINWIHERQKENQSCSAEEVNEMIECLNYVMDQVKIIGDYCIRDSEAVIELFIKLNVWISLIQLSTIAGVTPMELFTRGQQIRGVSLIYDIAVKKGYVLDSRSYSKLSWSGGFVWDPIPGLYPNVICLDFKSLYPNIIRAYNICWTTLVPPWLDHVVPDDMCNIIEWDEPLNEGDYEDETETDGDPVDLVGDIEEEEDNNGKVRKYRHYRFKFLKKEHKEGLLPQLAGNLIDERNKVRAGMKGIKDPIIKERENQKQLGLKVTANSLFGMLGAGQNGVLPLLEGAMCITAKGRELISFCNKYLVEKYGATVVYNDTDSTMVTIPNVTSGIDLLNWGKKLELEISAIFPDPLYLEFEKAGPMLCVKKKNYAFWILKKNGQLPFDSDGNPKFMPRGIPLARRDKPAWQSNIVFKAICMILTKSSHQEFLDMMIENVVRTLRGEMDWKDFIIIRSLGASYKQDNYFMKVFGDNLQKIGRPAQPGDRLEYVIVEQNVKPTGKELLGDKMRLPDIYIENKKGLEGEEIDYYYYIEKLLMNCLEGYWRVGYKDYINKQQEKNRLESYNAILDDLYLSGLSQWANEALAKNDNDPERAVKALLQTAIKNKVVMARRRHITGRDIFDTRISDKPIKTLLKGYRIGKLEQAVKGLASQELYNKLYPSIKTKSGLVLKFN